MTQGRAQKKWWRYSLGLLSVCAVYLLAGLVAQKPLTFLRWDNFELYIPEIRAAQTQISQGFLPLWNQAQHLGEPTLGLSQFGAFYPLYALAFQLSRLFGWGPPGFTHALVGMHLVIAELGFLALFAELGILFPLALAGSLIAITLGMMVASATFWIFTIAVFAWIPWLLWSGLRISSGARPVHGFLAGACFTGMLLSIGHSQYCAYTLIFVALIAFLYLGALRAGRRSWLLQSAAYALGICLAAPSILPTLLHLPTTAREHSYSKVDFLWGSLQWSDLKGIFSPLVPAFGGLWTEVSVMMYFGPWTIAALMGGVLIFTSGREPRNLRLYFVTVISVTILFLLFSLGANGKIYPLTYGLPIWSSFRMPKKFGLFFAAGMVVAATCALQLLKEKLSGRRAILFTAAVVLTSLVSLFLDFRHFLSAGSGSLLILGVLLAPIPLLIPHWKHSNWLLVIVSVLSGAASVAIVQDCHLKRYPEPLGLVDSVTLGVSDAFRVLPVGTKEASLTENDQLQERALSSFASVGNYRSATGSTTVLAPRHYLEWLPSGIFGLLPEENYEPLIGSHLLKSFNVKYLVTDRQDPRAELLLQKHKEVRKIKTLSRAQVWELDEAFPRAYFASHVFPASKEEIRKGLLKNEAPPLSAFVEAAALPSAEQEAKVTSIKWSAGAEAEFHVETSKGGLLIVSESYDPSWRASAAGVSLPVYRANGAILAIAVPKEAKTVRLYFDSKGLWQGLALMIAAVGALLFVLIKSLRH